MHILLYTISCMNYASFKKAVLNGLLTNQQSSESINLFNQYKDLYPDEYTLRVVEMLTDSSLSLVIAAIYRKHIPSIHGPFHKAEPSSRELLVN